MDISASGKRAIAWSLTKSNDALEPIFGDPVTVGSGRNVPGPPANQVRHRLHCKGIAAAYDLELEGYGAGEDILAADAPEGLRSFTRNGLRQMNFDGGSSHVMEHADPPVLMARRGRDADTGVHFPARSKVCFLPARESRNVHNPSRYHQK
jgi:hypothetical protein